MKEENRHINDQHFGKVQMALNRFSLNFIDPQLEQKFRKQYFINSLRVFRISLLTVIVLYASFGLLDYSLAETYYKEFYTVRFLLVIPILILVFISSYISFFSKIWQILGALGLIAAGSGIIYMLLKFPENIYYYGGMFLIFMGGYFFIKLRFFSAVISGISLLLIYNIGSIVFYNLFDIENIYWIAANAFFMSANIICIIGLYSSERLGRATFYQKQLLHDKQIEIELINEGLEEQVKNRTKELDKRNDKLEREILSREIIEQKLTVAKEKAEESDRLKTAFLANMSHEIRTPMNGILGFTELLKEPDLTGDEKDKYIQIIQKSGDRMLNTVNDIIEVSKIETGLLKAEYGTISINNILHELFQFFELEVTNKGMNLEFHTGLSEQDSMIRSDNSMLVSIVTNLVKNAIKYSKNGTIKFGYQLKDDTLEFYVKDEGIGISEKQQTSIFNRFTQENQDKSKAVEGSGLGLSISKAYIELLNGKIWVESTVGEGSCFYFTHPYHRISDDNEKKEKKNTPSAVNFKGKSLLIAEDEEFVFEYLNQVLLKTEIEITWAKNGKEALDACLAQNHFDTILMDINMPVMDGYEATKMIKKQFPQIPIIAQTAFAIKGDKEKIIAAGCDDYVSKPINKDLLFKALSKHI